MDYILDTHILIWALDNDKRLPISIKNIILNPNNDLYFSSISVMEVAIKHMRKPIDMPRNAINFYHECLDSGYFTLPFKPKHAILLDNLYNEKHWDPFDRALITQAKQENMILLTHDEILQTYNETCIMYL